MTSDKASSRNQGDGSSADAPERIEGDHDGTWARRFAAARAFLAYSRPSAVDEGPAALASWLQCSDGQALIAAVDAVAGLAQPTSAGVSKNGGEDARKALLAMEIGKLVVSIGVEALAHAVARSPALHGSRVKNADAFAKELLDRLGDGDDETGLSLIQHALDDAAEQAAEQGSKNIVCPGDGR